MKDENNKIRSEEEYYRALIKKAMGYDAKEIVEEYSPADDGEIKLCKKKVTVKNVPPDVSALKILMEKENVPLTSYTDEELEREKARLLKMLSVAEKNKKEKKSCKKKKEL